MKTMKRLKTLIALFLVQAFVLSGIAFAVPEERAVGISREKAVTDPAKITIPREYGLVMSRFSAGTGRLIIHIQDAHCNYEAQSNIAKILEDLIRDYGLRFVAVEGADGTIDASRFQAFHDNAVRREVADHFMKKGEITGPEFLSITSERSLKLFGAETGLYYNKNLDAFMSSYKLKGEAEGYFNGIKASLNMLKKRIYSEELKTVDMKIEEYGSGRTGLNDHVRFLQAEAARLRIDIRSHENLFKLAEVLIYEKRLDLTMSDKERGSLVDELSAKLAKEDIIELVAQSISFKIGKISSSEYYAYLRDVAYKNGMDLSKDYPHLYSYIIYNSTYSLIDNEQIPQEIKACEASIKEKLFRNDDERSLEKLSRHADILLSLINMRLLSDELDYYMAHKAEFASGLFTAFIEKEAGRYGIASSVKPPAGVVMEGIAATEEFYMIAVKRDKALVENTLREMKREGRRVAALVTGGFHSEGMKKLLAKEGVSYIVVSPSITKETPSPYVQILTNKRPAFEAIAVGAIGVRTHGVLAPPTITQRPQKKR